MIDHRTAFLAIVLLVASPVLAADDPAAPIVAIYRIVSAGDGTVGGYVITRKQSRHRWLSRSFAVLWDKSDAVTPKGDENPPGADPITDSQDPKVRDPQVVVEKRDAGTAVVAASFRSWGDETRTVRYDMVREGGAWKIDDIAHQVRQQGRQLSVVDPQGAGLQHRGHAQRTLDHAAERQSQRAAHGQINKKTALLP